jgi:cysteine desulfurase
MKRFYLDENATTRLDPGVAAIMARLAEGLLGNPSSLHGEGRRARGEIDAARDEVAAWLGAKSSEIIFTSGGTESCNLAVLGLARAHRGRGRHLITAATEHHAVLHAFTALEKRDAFAVTYLLVDSDGRVDPAELEAALRPDTVLVSIMSANNETGVCQPMRELGAICTRHGVLFHSDAVQSVGKEPIDLEGWGVSALSLTAHKFHGPLGAGVLWLRGGLPVVPLMEGGAHENERRPGTENTVAIAGLAAALARHGTPDFGEVNRQRVWIEDFWTSLRQLGEVRRNGHPVERLANTLNVTFDGLHPEEFLIALDLAGLAVSSGSACLVGSVQSSHVLAAMGCASGEGATVRFSIGPEILDCDLEEIVARVGQVVRHQRSLRGTLVEVSS